MVKVVRNDKRFLLHVMLLLLLTLLYFISAGRPIPRVCIDGNKQPGNNWLLEDGSPLTYFNWTPGDPDGGSNQLCLIIYSGDQWLDTKCSYDQTCIFVCEA